MYTQEEINLITLSSFSEIPYDVKKHLLDDFYSGAVFKNRESFLIKTLSSGVYNKVKELFYDKVYRAELLKDLENKGIKCVSYYSEAYPETLKNIPSPPVLLYCKGDVSLLKTDCLSIVGARRTPAKTLADCRKISGEASKFFTIVSGIAEGADSAALEGALSENGKVISVLANGFDRIYPAVNREFAYRIEKRGLLVSEFPPETLAKPYYFPIRNRIIAGLSKGTLVVSAGERSGALITANYAVDYGRDVFAFPYSIGLPSGAGCNALIKKGAFLADNILDIFEVYGLDFNTPAENSPLSEEENDVYTAVKMLGDAFLPEVAKNVKKSVNEIIPVICALQIKNRVVKLGGNRYSAV